MIAMVIPGQALRAFHFAAANPDLDHPDGQFPRAGVELAVCGNTMQDLLPGLTVAEKGGVVRIAELRSQGHLYLKP